MFGNEDHTNEVVLLTPITDNSGIMRALKVCFGNIKMKGRVGTFFLPTCMIYRYLLNHLTVVEIRCNFILFFSCREGDYDEFLCHLQGLCDLYQLSRDT